MIRTDSSSREKVLEHLFIGDRHEDVPLRHFSAVEPEGCAPAVAA
jgi:hypothetical protein